MNASFEEKSVWIQLVSMVVMLGLYFAVAGTMLASGVTQIIAYVPVFAVAVVLMVALMVASYIVVAVASRPEGRDERDRLIDWRAESNSSWLLAVGVLAAIWGLVLSIDGVWIAHMLLLSLFLSTILKFLFQVVYYRRGV